MVFEINGNLEEHSLKMFRQQGYIDIGGTLSGKTSLVRVYPSTSAYRTIFKGVGGLRRGVIEQENEDGSFDVWLDNTSILKQSLQQHVVEI